MLEGLLEGFAFPLEVLLNLHFFEVNLVVLMAFVVPVLRLQVVVDLLLYPR